MSRPLFAFLAVAGGLVLGTPAIAQKENPQSVVYQGTSGPGQGKQIVFIAGDQEYRSEESLPMLARILARRYGFKATVFFATNPQTGFIDVESSSMSGLEALDTADLLVLGLRFRDFPDDQMQHIADFLTRGGAVIGLRTSTHSFQIRRPGAKFLAWDHQSKDPNFENGFGRQILGETWVSHYGTNHVQFSRLSIVQGYEGLHPILRGVKDMFMQSGGYTADPMPGSNILALGEILSGPTPNSPPVPTKKQLPVAWTRTYTYGAAGKPGRVFTTTHGASEDFLNEGFRRMVVNAALWGVGLETAIKPTNDISFVGPFKPSPFRFGGAVEGVKPADLAGWTTAIMPKAPPPPPPPAQPRGGGRGPVGAPPAGGRPGAPGVPSGLPTAPGQ